MAAVVRTLLYASVITALVLILLPADTFDPFDVTRGSPMGIAQVTGAVITLSGVGLALWCAIAFAVLGRGTPLPFDPPRRLVIVGPYRWVRNPMAIGVGLALIGVSVYYESPAVLLFAGVFMLIIHAFVVLYEEPTLRRMFGAEYAAYCGEVNRWLPHRPTDREPRWPQPRAS